MEVCGNGSADRSLVETQDSHTGECQSQADDAVCTLSRLAWDYVRRDAAAGDSCPSRQPDTPDGGYVIRDSDGKIVTTWADGTLRVQRQDERGYVRRPGSGGSYQEEHWGKRPEDNFQITRTTVGDLQITEKKGGKPLTWMKDSGVESSRNKLLEAAEQSERDPQHLSKLRADMARLEHRAQQQGLSPAEVEKTYESVARILKAQGDSPLTPAQRTAVAEQTLSQAATPGSVDQGIYGTCNVSSVEVRTFTRTPSAAAKLVADVTTTGSFQAEDDSKVTIRASSLKPYAGADKNPPEDGARSHASQIFQVTAVNLGHLKKSPHYEYALEERNGSDNGERLYNKMNGKDNDEVMEDGKPARAPSLDEDQIESVSNIITGKKESGFVLVHDGYRSGDDITRIKSKEELRAALAQAQREGKFPVIVRVDAANQPFFRDSSRGTSGGSDGAHVVTVTGHDSGPPARVTIDNTWGSKSDHPRGSEVTVHDLYAAMRSASDRDRLKEMRKEVKFDQRRNQADPAKVFDLHRQEHDAKLSALKEAEEEHTKARNQRVNGEITHGEYSRARTAHERAAQQYGYAQEKYFKSILNDAGDTARNWAKQKAQGVLRQDEVERGVTMMLDVASTLPAQLRLEALKEYKKLGLISDKQFDDSIGETAQDAQKAFNEARKNGKFDANEFQKIRAEMVQVIFHLPDERRRELIDGLPIEQRLFHVVREQELDLITNAEYEDQLVAIMLKARQEWSEAEKVRDLDAAEKERCLTILKQLLSRLPLENRRAIQQKVQSAA